MAIDLENLLDENTECEYKEKESEGLYKTISAFSNTNGGCIIVGVETIKILSVSTFITNLLKQL